MPKPTKKRISLPVPPPPVKPQAKIQLEAYFVFFLAFVALALVISLIAPMVKKTSNTNTVGQTNQTLQQLAAHSFGDLTSGVSSANASRSSTQVGAPNAMTSTDSAVKTSEITAPDSIAGFAYSYAGSLPAISQTSQVIKRVTSLTGLDATSTLGNFGLGLINLSTFTGLSVQQISFSQATTDGYVISVDGYNGSISLYKSTSGMTKDIATTCSGTTCATNQALPPVTVPSDDTLITLSNSFLQNHGVQRSSYGDPEISQPLNFLRPMTEGTSSYVSDYVSIVYPMLLNGQSVYSASGDIIGMQVSVNIRTMEVNAVYNIALQKYQTSTYENETNVANLKKIITQGGLYDIAPATDATPAEIKLDAPVSGYVQLTKYDNGTYDELYVPAFIFAISAGQEKAPTWKSRVVVPFVKELVQTYASTGTSGSGSSTPPSQGATDPILLIAPESN